MEVAQAHRAYVDNRSCDETTVLALHMHAFVLQAVIRKALACVALLCTLCLRRAACPCGGPLLPRRRRAA